MFQNVRPKLFVSLPDWGRTYAARAYDIGEDGWSNRVHFLTEYRGSVANCRHLGKQDSACCMYRAVYQVAGLLLHDITNLPRACEQIGRNQPKSRINSLRSINTKNGTPTRRPVPPPTVRCKSSSLSRRDMWKVHAYACRMLPLVGSRLLLWGLRDCELG